MYKLNFENSDIYLNDFKKLSDSISLTIEIGQIPNTMKFILNIFNQNSSNPQNIKCRNM